MSGTLAGRRSEHRIVLIDGHTFDVPPAEHMLMVTNDDRPGVIGTVGTLLGDAGVNIADMDVGRAEEAGTAVMLIAPTSPVAPATVEALRAAPGIISVAVLWRSRSVLRETCTALGRRKHSDQVLGGRIASRVAAPRAAASAKSSPATRTGSPG